MASSTPIAAPSKSGPPPTPGTASASDISARSDPKPTVAARVISYPFWFGGSASSMAACVTHPLDLVKVRLQTQHAAQGTRRNMLQMFAHVVQSDGVQGLYRGISASLLRQLTYSTARFGVYEQLKQSIQASSSSTSSSTSQPQSLSFATLVGIASISGLVGGLAGNPGDVLNVRMQHDAALPAAERRNYRNVLDGLVRMAREEGPTSLFRGVGPNCARAVLMTSSQLATYDQFKSLLRSGLGMADNLTTHFSASLLAGFVATTVCSPFDVIKTRVMSATSGPASSRAAAGPGGQSIASFLASVYRAEGFGWMFRGWVPSFIRLGPQTIFTFLFLEQHKKWYRQMKDIPGF